ncbi:hypothetical protein B5E84_05360 [Lachnoclostridium sp. An14]|uniref:hypothetical protein n=1 Tax=Lachnoclostridium sp. An14 TaxID=1965562 RepID=UPI000B3A244C|nr:hypothetical protein [Lachnoclostridium sp. An14]OUQ20162.1 hypothetical protein B5E84_05360 [Lachnoclostridium sp. An14]
MRKLLKSILIGILIAILGTSPTFAQTATQENSHNQNLQEKQQVIVQLYDPRGNWVADGILSISNPRNGRIGIYMTTQCHVAVDEIQMDIAVEQYDEDRERWNQVDYLTYNFYPSGGKPLTEASVDFQLSGHESNCTYRLRGWHTVFVNGNYEELKSETPGIKITG